MRSFIIALRDAARGTSNSSRTAMTYDQIKRGVQQASYNRVEQLKEDYVWIEDVLKPLAGLERNPFRLCRGLGVRRGHSRRP